MMQNGTDTLSEAGEKEVTLEELFAQIDEILEKMEKGDPGLDELFSLYEQGLNKLKLCNEKLDMIEKKMLVLNAQNGAEEFE